VAAFNHQSNQSVACLAEPASELQPKQSVAGLAKPAQASARWDCDRPSRTTLLSARL